MQARTGLDQQVLAHLFQQGRIVQAGPYRGLGDAEVGVVDQESEGLLAGVVQPEVADDAPGGGGGLAVGEGEGAVGGVIIGGGQRGDVGRREVHAHIVEGGAGAVWGIKSKECLGGVQGRYDKLRCGILFALSYQFRHDKPIKSPVLLHQHSHRNLT